MLDPRRLATLEAVVRTGSFALAAAETELRALREGHAGAVRVGALASAADALARTISAG